MPAMEPRLVCPDHCDAGWRESLARELGGYAADMATAREEIKEIKSAIAALRRMFLGLAIVVSSITGAAQLPALFALLK
jgi:hypothetical protein